MGLAIYSPQENMAQDKALLLRLRDSEAKEFLGWREGDTSSTHQEWVTPLTVLLWWRDTSQGEHRQGLYAMI